MFVDEQVGVNSAAKAYAINRLLMEMTKIMIYIIAMLGLSKSPTLVTEPHACHRMSWLMLIPCLSSG